MIPQRLLVFDDGQGSWGPMTDLRAVFELRTGALTTLARIERLVGRRADMLRVPEPLAALVADRHPQCQINQTPEPDGGGVLCVNGRWLGVGFQSVIRELALNEALAQIDGQIIAVHLDAGDPALHRFIHGTGDAAAAHADHRATLNLTPHVAARRISENILLDRPWQILARLESTLNADLLAMDVELFKGQDGVSVEASHPIKVAASARVHTMVVLNAEKGPIVIDEHALVGSFAVVAGPCYIGPHTIVGPHAHIRANTSFGQHCLVGGEISHTVFDAFSNKAHAGYLGNSLVGQWVNFGADTNASNLKNTYGSVRMQLSDRTDPEDSGQGKLGPLVGDFTRTAIGTRLVTGSCISTGTMLALSSFAPKFTPRFAFLTDDQTDRYDIDRFLAAADKAMARRQRSLTAPETDRLRHLAAMM